MRARSDKIVAGHYVPEPGYSLVICEYTDQNGVSHATGDIALCSNLSQNVNYTHLCDTTKNHCGAPVFEIRLTTYQYYAQCSHIPYMDILSIRNWGIPDNVSVISTNYRSAPTTYNPSLCGYANTNSKIQARFVLNSFWTSPAQSLYEYAKIQPSHIKVTRMGIIYLR